MASHIDARRPWWREPLVHFLTAGALIFAVTAWRGSELPERRDHITVTPVQVERLAGLWQQTWGRLPTETELQGLVRDNIAEEVYYREALALGLHINDPIVRRRMRQKMEFLVSEAPDIVNPDEQTLRAWFADNNNRYEIPANYAFDQVFLADTDQLKTQQMLAQLNAGIPASELTESTSLPTDMDMSTEEEIRAIFGAEFIGELERLTPSEWVGPVQSGFGVHLVRVTDYSAARAAAFEDVATRVRADWISETIRLRREDRFAAILERYEVIIESPDE